MAIDYTEQLARIRNDNFDKVEKLKSVYEQDIKNVKDTNLKRQNELQTQHNLRKDELIKQNNEKIARTNKKTQDLLAQRRDAYKKSLYSEQDKFSKESSKQREAFKQRLKDIKDTYDKSLSSHKETDRSLRDSMRTNFQDRLDTTKKRAEQEVSDIQRKSDESIENYKNTLLVQKNDLIEKHRKDTSELIAGHRDQNLKNKNYYENKIEYLNDSHTQELDRATALFDSNSQRKDRDTELEKERLTYNFEEAVDSLKASSQRDYRTLQSNFKRQMEDVLRQSDQDIYFHQKQASDIREASLKGEGVEFQKQAIADSYERRLENLRNMLHDQKEQFQANIQNLYEELKEERKNQKFALKKKSDVQDKEYRQGIKERVQDNRNKQAATELNFRRELQNLSKLNEARSIAEENRNKRIISNQKKVYGDTINKITEAQIKSVNEIQDDFAEEKRLIVKNARELLEETSKEERESYLNRVQNLMQSYEQRIDSKDQEIRRIKEEKERGIANMKDTLQRSLKIASEYHNEQRDSYLSSAGNDVKLANKQNEMQLREFKAKRDSDISKIKQDHDLQVTKLTRKYEDQINTLIATNQRDLKKKVGDVRKELRNYMASAKFEKENIINTYERKLRDLKQQREVEKLKEYSAKKS